MLDSCGSCYCVLDKQVWRVDFSSLAALVNSFFGT